MFIKKHKKVQKFIKKCIKKVNYLEFFSLKTY